MPSLTTVAALVPQGVSCAEYSKDPESPAVKIFFALPVGKQSVSAGKYVLMPVVTVAKPTFGMSTKIGSSAILFSLYSPSFCFNSSQLMS
jgi:hypothetical protein